MGQAERYLGAGGESAGFGKQLCSMGRIAMASQKKMQISEKRNGPKLMYWSCESQRPSPLSCLQQELELLGACPLLVDNKLTPFLRQGAFLEWISRFPTPQGQCCTPRGKRFYSQSEKLI